MSRTFAHLIYFLRGIMAGKNTMKLPVILAVMVLLSLFAVSQALAKGDSFRGKESDKECGRKLDCW